MCNDNVLLNKPSEAEVWVKVVESYTRASNSISSDKAVAWADKITYAYKTRYLNNSCNGDGK